MELLSLQSSDSTSTTGWQRRSAQLLSAASLAALFDGRIPAIILPRFLPQDSCERIVANLRSLGMGTYAHVNHSVGRFGLAQMEHHLKGSKEGYFEQVASAERAYREAIQGSVDPQAKLMSFLSQATAADVGVASEPPCGRYFAGTFRNVMTVGHLHFDFAPFEAKGWAIENVNEQLSWNLYLNEPVGGNLHVYDRAYVPSDERFHVEGEYFYDPIAVEGRHEFVYTPKVGDVVIFNSRNFHEVKPVSGDRYTLSSFIGRLADKNIILWS